MDKLMRLYMARHGQIVGYERIPICGHTDVLTTEVGKMQLEHLAERLRLADIRAIYSSDLQRSVKGAQIIARYHDVPLHSLPELREMYFGEWEGLALEEVRQRFPHELEKRQAEPVDYRPPGNGESVRQLSGRVMACFQNILENQKGDDILFVGHGAVNRVILCNALGLDLSRMFHLKQDFGCLNIIDYYADSTQVNLMNG